MPELPEVETIRQDLRKKILNKKIVRVVVYNKKSVGGLNTNFIHVLEGNAITEIDRRGKLMIFRLKRPTVILTRQLAGKNLSRKRLDPSGASLPQDDNRASAVLVHLKMTGQLIYVTMSSPRRRGSTIGYTGSPVRSGMTVVAGGHKLSESDIENLPNQWTRVAFVFEDGGELFFNDQRLFGYMKLASSEAVEKALTKFGPEPVVSPPARGGARGGGSFTFDYFSSLFKKRAKTTLKAMLLNQELIAGLGNIYVDEACFVAKVKPMRRVGSITTEEQKALFKSIPKILTLALRHRGTTFRNFLDSSGKKGNYIDFLKVYDRDGEPCRRCDGIIKKTKAAGRGTHYCPQCQK